MANGNSIETRAVNLWAHIRNWYEVRSLEDNQRLVEDMASHGFNDLWITMERELFRNYLDDQVSDDNGRRFWWKLKELGRFAHNLGMKVTVLDELNTVFLDQCDDPELAHLISDPRRPWGIKNVKYDFCPSRPQARKIILKNHEDAYKDFPIVDAMVLQPYDPSGCGCDECDPWPRTYLTLARELVEKLWKYHPNAEVILSVWDFGEEQIKMIIDLLRDDQSGMFHGVMDKEWLMFDLKRGQETERWAGLPERYKRIPYIDLCQIGAWGWHCFTANPHPTRFETLFKLLHKAGITNYASYSEDVHDDINKYLIAGLGKNSDKTARELMNEYAVRYFQAAVGDDLYEVACMMEAERTNKLGSPWEQEPIMDLEAAWKIWSALEDIEGRIPGYAVKSWRWQVLSTRAEISVLVNEIGDLEETKARLDALFREVLEVSTVEDGHGKLQQAENLIQAKKRKLELLKDTVDSFRTDVLKEPGYRTIRVRGALPSYYDWMKMLVDAEETGGLAVNNMLAGMQRTIRKRLGLSD